MWLNELEFVADEDDVLDILISEVCDEGVELAVDVVV